DAGFVVDVVVDVDGDGDGDDRLPAELDEHGDHAFEKLDAHAMLWFGDGDEEFQGVENGGTLHGRTARDRVVPGRIGFCRSSSRFSDVERSPEGGPAKLIRERCISPGQPRRQVDRQAQEFDGTPVHIEALEAHHPPWPVPGAAGCASPSPSPSPSTTTSTSTAPEPTDRDRIIGLT